MNVMIFGAGNIGSVLVKELCKEKVKVGYIVRTSGIFDCSSKKIAEQKDWRKFADKADLAFICIPSTGEGQQAFEYEMYFLEKNKPVISCEKTSIAYHWNILKKYKKIFKYTASVGGGTKMLSEITKYNPEKIREIKAVVNGTLNYISDQLKSGKTKNEIVKIILKNGYAEPGANTFEEIVKGEINDVLLKTAIIANHSGIFDKVINTKDIMVSNFDASKRCAVHISKNNIQAGFIENTEADWLPKGINNILYINSEKKAHGKGAGAEATVSSMVSDFKDLSQSR